MIDRSNVRLMVVVAAALINEGEVLLLRRSADEQGWPGYWEVPGGKRRVDETCWAALAREVREESALRLPQKAIPCHVFDYCSGLNVTDALDATQVTFLAELERRGTVTLSKEHSDFRWAHFEEALTMTPMSAETSAAIKAAFQLANDLR